MRTAEQKARHAAAERRRRRERLQRMPDVLHGTINGYTNYGCRCDECRNASRIYRRQLPGVDTPEGAREYRRRTGSPAGTGNGSKRQWAPQEDRYVLATMQRPTIEVARDLKRSMHAVAQRRYVLRRKLAA